LAKHLSARGYGSKDALVATGREDPSDALDRRIEFKPVTCS
jgi:outer membrane protein OmpA-like peptidoglycan-associated protein